MSKNKKPFKFNFKANKNNVENVGKCVDNLL